MATKRGTHGVGSVTTQGSNKSQRVESVTGTSKGTPALVVIFSTTDGNHHSVTKILFHASFVVLTASRDSGNVYCMSHVEIVSFGLCIVNIVCDCTASGEKKSQATRIVTSRLSSSISGALYRKTAFSKSENSCMGLASIVPSLADTTKFCNDCVILLSYASKACTTRGISTVGAKSCTGVRIAIRFTYQGVICIGVVVYKHIFASCWRQIASSISMKPAFLVCKDNQSDTKRRSFHTTKSSILYEF